MQHITASRLHELQPWRFTDGTVFGVFRDPWDRLVSLWSFLFHGDVEMTPANFRAWIKNGMRNRYNQDATLYIDEPGEVPIPLVSPQVTWLDDPAVEVIRHDVIGNFAPGYNSGKTERNNGGWWVEGKNWYDDVSRHQVMHIIEPDLDFQNERKL